MSVINMLYKKRVPINDNISIVVPTVGEIIDDEESYYGLLSSLIAMPIDLMVQLDDIGIDFSSIDQYELFLILFGAIKQQDTHLIFGDLDLSKFEIGVNEQNQNVVLIDSEHDIIIDRAIHDQITKTLRSIHHIEKDIRKPANDEAKKYLIERARAKQKRRKNKKESSQLEPLIVAMVNTPEFKYKFDEVLDLSIYQFNESVLQIIKKVDYNNQMHGVYSGTVDIKTLSKDDLNWLIHK